MFRFKPILKRKSPKRKFGTLFFADCTATNGGVCPALQYNKQGYYTIKSPVTLNNSDQTVNIKF